MAKAPAEEAKLGGRTCDLKFRLADLKFCAVVAMLGNRAFLAVEVG
jgi:hypothetical protein